MFDLRPYQSDAVAKTHARLEQGHRPIVCAPCGSGKTVIAGHMAREAMEQGKRVLWITGREEILRQAFRTFSAMCGQGNVGFLMRDEGPWWFYPKVTVASWDTLKARWAKSDSWKIPADVLLVDEAHLSLSRKMCQTIMPFYKERTVVGFTATPARKSGKGLGSYYTRIIQVRKVQDIIDDGFLAPCEYWAGSHADTERLGIDYKTGDFKSRDLGAAHNDKVLIGDVVDNWLRLASDRHTIVFAVDIAHAQALTERFQSAGVTAEVIHSKLLPGTRALISEQFRESKFQVLINVGIATYGYDVPEVNCVVIARPTRSIVLWHQMVGRGMRPKADGDHCKVLDHGDNVRRLGCIEDEIRWRLDEGKPASVNTTREGDESRKKPPEAPPIECGSCHYVFSRSRICPKCGWEKPLASRDIETVEADLVKVRKAKKDAAQQDWPDEKTFYLMLLHYARSMGYSPGWAAHKYREKHDKWPGSSWKSQRPIDPSPRVYSWIRSQQIRWAKSRRKSDEPRPSL